MKVSGAVAMADDPEHAFGISETYANSLKTGLMHVPVMGSVAGADIAPHAFGVHSGPGPEQIANYAEHYHSEGAEVRYWTKANGEQYKTVVTRCEPGEPATLVTAKDISIAIWQDGEPLQAAVDRLKNWTTEGLIDVAGELHPGKGKSRQYAPKALAGAVVMQALVNIGMTAVAASRVVGLMHETNAP